MKTKNLNKNIFFAATLIGLAIPTAFLSSCGEPVDRNAIVNPKIEGKLITMANVSDVTKNSVVFYSRTENVDTVSAKSGGLVTAFGGKTEKSNIDTNKLLTAISVEDKKAFVEAHSKAGGVFAFSAINGTIRVFAVVDRTEVAQIAEKGVKDLTLEDIKDAKENRIAKTARVERVRKSDPSFSARLVEVAAIELEKSGALESEKTDYSETKPLLNILVNLPVEVSTHAILKGEETKTSALATFAKPTAITAPAKDDKSGDKK